MIGGIFCDCNCGDDYRIYQVLLGEKTIKNLQEINAKGELMYSGKFSIIDSPKLVPPIGKLLIKHSYNALSRRGSASHRRGFENETTDLMKSFGVAVYHDQKLLFSRRFNGGRSEKPAPATPKHWLGSYDAYFNEFITDFPNAHPKQLNGWHIVYVATMPYAVRLEKVNEKGKYGKKVLIGQIGTIIKELNRDVSKITSDDSWPLVRDMMYGYYFRQNKKEDASGPEFVRKANYGKK